MRSCIAIPCDSKSVTCSHSSSRGGAGDHFSQLRQHAHVQAPFRARAADRRFLHRARARIHDGGIALRTVASSISRRSSELDPAAFTCVRARSIRRRTPGRGSRDGDDDVAPSRNPRPSAQARRPSRASRHALAELRDFFRIAEKTCAPACARETRPRAALGLPSRSEDSCHLRVRAQPFRRDATRSAGAHHAEVVRLDDAFEPPVLRAERVHEESHALAARRVRLVSNTFAEGTAPCRMCSRRGPAGALARNVDRLAGGVFAMHALDELERLGHRQ